MAEHDIVRLRPEHAAAIVDCFRRVYGDTYANPLFYDAAGLGTALEAGAVRSVGALIDGRIEGHMALTRTVDGATSAELGNTVVDPVARGAGLAWRVGAELTRWTRELGFTGFLHYPTTDHHIMQEHSVQRGIETGLMLGYVPATTDGGVRARSSGLRGAATIVFESLADSHEARDVYLPGRLADLCAEFAAACKLPRQWLAGQVKSRSLTEAELRRFTRRGVARLEVTQAGSDLGDWLEALGTTGDPCQQLDLGLDDPCVASAADQALDSGFVYCGWLPGFRSSDVLRLQRVDLTVTDLAPGVVNPVGRRLLDELTAALTR